jgi:hypothetical protein
MQESMQEPVWLRKVVVLVCLCMHMRHMPVAVVRTRGVWPCFWPHTHVCLVVRLWGCVPPLLHELPLLVLLLSQSPPLSFVSVTHGTLGCCDGGAIGSCIKGLEAFE